ncbi:hypothetical protein GCM10009605_57110 [Nocardiopsis composta]
MADALLGEVALRRGWARGGEAAGNPAGDLRGAHRAAPPRAGPGAVPPVGAPSPGAPGATAAGPEEEWGAGAAMPGGRGSFRPVRRHAEVRPLPRSETVGHASGRPECPTADRPAPARRDPPLRPGRQGAGHSPILVVLGVIGRSRSRGPYR